MVGVTLQEFAEARGLRLGVSLRRHEQVTGYFVLLTESDTGWLNSGFFSRGDLITKDAQSLPGFVTFGFADDDDEQESGFKTIFIFADLSSATLFKLRWVGSPREDVSLG